ncbi:trans-2-enoyl-CoA reductase (NADPH) [Trifolium repens]|nr:trans-2-enoyl-CoA reductase (NADPH) [Trifolium repens]
MLPSNTVSSNVHPLHLPYIVLGNRGYPIDESSFKYKRQRHNSSNNRDMISDLPDCILHIILSFLPTKDAVKTSILATKWSELFNMRNQPDLCNLSKCIVLSIWSLGNKAVGGYEGVRQVDSVGAAVTAFSPGDWVIPSPPSVGTASPSISYFH